MPLLLIGIVLLLAKLAGFGPPAQWSWWVILLPFALAAAWWHFADASGLTERRVMDRIEQKKADRRAQQMENLGLDSRRDARARRERENAKLRASADPTQLIDEGKPPQA